MTGKVEQRILDYGLETLNAEATHIVLCADEPTAYSLCSIGAANVIGYKQFEAGGAFGDVSTHTLGGRYVASSNITDGTICQTGVAMYWAAIDSANGRLLAHNALGSEPRGDTAGNKFFMPPFSMRIPSEQ